MARVNDPLRALETADVIACPDLYHNDFESIARLNRPTFGAGEGNKLETDRWFLKEFLTEHDLPVVKSVEIQGTDDLRDFLQDDETRTNTSRSACFVATWRRFTTSIGSKVKHGLMIW